MGSLLDKPNCEPITIDGQCIINAQHKHSYKHGNDTSSSSSSSSSSSILTPQPSAYHIQFGASSIQGWRKYQEDRFCFSELSRFPSSGAVFRHHAGSSTHHDNMEVDTLAHTHTHIKSHLNMLLFSIFDGHGGFQTSQYCHEHFHPFLQQKLERAFQQWQQQRAQQQAAPSSSSSSSSSHPSSYNNKSDAFTESALPVGYPLTPSFFNDVFLEFDRTLPMPDADTIEETLKASMMSAGKPDNSTNAIPHLSSGTTCSLCVIDLDWHTCLLLTIGDSRVCSWSCTNIANTNKQAQQNNKSEESKTKPPIKISMAKKPLRSDIATSLLYVSQDHSPDVHRERQRLMHREYQHTFLNVNPPLSRICHSVQRISLNVVRGFGDLWFKLDSRFPQHEQMVVSLPEHACIHFPFFHAATQQNNQKQDNTNKLQKPLLSQSHKKASVPTNTHSSSSSIVPPSTASPLFIFMASDGIWNSKFPISTPGLTRKLHEAYMHDDDDDNSAMNQIIPYYFTMHTEEHLQGVQQRFAQLNDEFRQRVHEKGVQDQGCYILHDASGRKGRVKQQGSQLTWQPFSTQPADTTSATAPLPITHLLDPMNASSTPYSSIISQTFSKLIAHPPMTKEKLKSTDNMTSILITITPLFSTTTQTANDAHSSFTVSNQISLDVSSVLLGAPLSSTSSNNISLVDEQISDPFDSVSPPVSLEQHESKSHDTPTSPNHHMQHNDHDDNLHLLEEKQTAKFNGSMDVATSKVFPSISSSFPISSLSSLSSSSNSSHALPSTSSSSSHQLSSFRSTFKSSQLPNSLASLALPTTNGSSSARSHSVAVDPFEDASPNPPLSQPRQPSSAPLLSKSSSTLQHSNNQSFNIRKLDTQSHFHQQVRAYLQQSSLSQTLHSPSQFLATGTRPSPLLSSDLPRKVTKKRKNDQKGVGSVLLPSLSSSDASRTSNTNMFVPSNGRAFDNNLLPPLTTVAFPGPITQRLQAANSSLTSLSSSPRTSPSHSPPPAIRRSSVPDLTMYGVPSKPKQKAQHKHQGDHLKAQQPPSSLHGTIHSYANFNFHTLTGNPAPSLHATSQLPSIFPPPHHLSATSSSSNGQPAHRPMGKQQPAKRSKFE